MSAWWTAVRAGFERGWIELKQTYTNADSLIPTVIVLAGFILVMLITRRTVVPGTHFSLGTTMLVSLIGMNVGVNGLATMGALLATEREDGTLLRAKATPNGMAGYLIGKIVAVSGVIVIGVVTTFIPGSFLFHGLAVGSATAWLTLIWVLALGLVATLPMGAVLGSLFPSARSAGLITLAIGGITAVSGIFYPITHLPQWLQVIGQVFPLYWLGLGMRSALLPVSLASVEIGHSWRHLATFGVLGAWAGAGLLVAPVLLRRMARHESGSAVAARREKAMLRVQ
ncbi:MAG TPA: ABC transporter permease [Streptosporangiaceae bacterium]|nr:ABC transporter permease [Streptosporangiaceae bacterium]